MQFALLIYESPEAFAARNSNDENDPYLGAWRTYHKALLEAGIYVDGNPLREPRDCDYCAAEGRQAARSGWPIRG